MVAFTILTPYDTIAHIAKQARAKRLFLNFSQKTLSERAGVSLGVIKKFEQSGKISVESLLKIALVLNALEEFQHLFKPKDPLQYTSIAELLKEKPRKRGRG